MSPLAAPERTAEQRAVGALLLQIAQTPAPTGSEEARAQLIERLWQQAGLTTERDGVGNVIARLPGTSGAPRVLVACHLDSVFGPDVDITVDAGEERWSGAGVGDNAASLALLTHYLLTADPTELRPHLTLAATVGEEGLGNLRGARAVVADLASSHDLFIALDGYLGGVVTTAVGSYRFEALFKTAGGHSWGDYPAPSAVHAAAEAAARLAKLNVPNSPRSSLNVGQIWGGTSINSIAENAGFNLDLRSVDAETLERLKHSAVKQIEAGADAIGAELELTEVGHRPTGRSDNRELADAAHRAYQAAGVSSKSVAGSTDANAAIAASMPAICFGVYRGGNAHRLDEWVDPSSFHQGLTAWRELLKELARPSLAR